MIWKLGRGSSFDMTPLLGVRGEEGAGFKSKTFTPITKSSGVSLASMLTVALNHCSISKIYSKRELEKNKASLVQQSPVFLLNISYLKAPAPTYHLLAVPAGHLYEPSSSQRQQAKMCGLITQREDISIQITLLV